MKSRISKITVGRLFNLGNYEHIRYEICTEVQEGQSAETALRGIEKILDALNPKRPAGVKSTSELLLARRRIEEVQATSDDEVARLEGKSKVVVLATMEKEYAAERERALAWGKYKADARAALDDLGGTFTLTDHKRFWEEELDVEF